MPSPGLSCFKDTTECLYDCGADGDIEDYGMGCSPMKKEDIGDSSSATVCICDTGDECNNVPCTEEGLKEAGATMHKIENVSWLSLVAIWQLAVALAMNPYCFGSMIYLQYRYRCCYNHRSAMSELHGGVGF